MDSVKYPKYFVVLVGLLVLTSGCLGSISGGGSSDAGGSDGGSSGGAEIKFNENKKNGLGIQVVDMGSYDSVFVEIQGFSGGFEISGESNQPYLYIMNSGYMTMMNVCYKKSVDAKCNNDALFDKDTSGLSPDSKIKVYGVKNGEKTLIRERN